MLLGLLFFGNIEGKIAVINASNVFGDSIEEEIIYPILDTIRVDHIKLITYEDYMFIIAIKNSTLLIALVNKEGVFIDQQIVYCDNINITGMRSIFKVLVNNYHVIYQGPLVFFKDVNSFMYIYS